MFNIDGIIRALQTDRNAKRTALTGAAGLAAGMLLSGGGLGKLAGNAAKVGAVAAIGGIAYAAWKNHQQQLGGVQPTLEDFAPSAHAPVANEELGKKMVRAMIAAAKADGQIDADEKRRIFSQLETMPLSAEEKAFVFDELSGPLDMDAIVASADRPEHAADIYAASLVAMVADTDLERSYLNSLAQRLGLEAGLVAEIHRAAELPPAASAQHTP